MRSPLATPPRLSEKIGEICAERGEAGLSMRFTSMHIRGRPAAGIDEFFAQVSGV